jgi:hypothetical protein
MSFRVLGLSPALFCSHFKMSDAGLKAIGAIRVFAAEPGLPCRVSLGHAAVGDEVLLLNYEHQPGNTPYRARHAIYVSRASTRAFDGRDEVPEALACRLLSVRAFDDRDMMIDAEIAEGKVVADLFERLLANPETSYLQVHNARRGCYAARVERA